MLTSEDQYKRAVAVVGRLATQIADLRERGEPVPPALLERAKNGAEEVVCYELAQEGRAQRGRTDYASRELQRRRRAAA